PGYTPYVVEKIAEFRQLTFEEVAEQTRDNAHRLFRIDK
ncbi:TatD family hydrolase, partial [Enterococcus faecalis]